MRRTRITYRCDICGVKKRRLHYYIEIWGTMVKDEHASLEGGYQDVCGDCVTRIERFVKRIKGNPETDDPLIKTEASGDLGNNQPHWKDITASDGKFIVAGASLGTEQKQAD